MKYLFLALSLLLISCSNEKNYSDFCLSGDFKSYYLPSKGTKNVQMGVPCDKPKLYGNLDHDLIVMSDIGVNVVYINKDGTQKWQYVGSSRLKDLRIIGQKAQVIDGNMLVLIELKSGKTHKTIIDSGYQLHSDEIKIINNAVFFKSNIFEASYPRSAINNNQYFVVANTFGHKLDVYDSNGIFIYSEPFYFPNEITFFDQQNVLITEEHSNRIMLFNLDTKERTVLVSCEISIFQDPNSLPINIAQIERTGALELSGKGACLNKKLYSPNGVSFKDQSLVVSDTDNHRVVIFDDLGNETASITGFNNPVRAFYVEN